MINKMQNGTPPGGVPSVSKHKGKTVRRKMHGENSDSNVYVDETYFPDSDQVLYGLPGVDNQSYGTATVDIVPEKDTTILERAKSEFWPAVKRQIQHNPWIPMTDPWSRMKYWWGGQGFDDMYAASAAPFVEGGARALGYNPTTAAVAGLAGGILLDPTTYIGGVGAAKGVVNGAKAAMKLNSIGARALNAADNLVDAAQAAGKWYNRPFFEKMLRNNRAATEAIPGEGKTVLRGYENMLKHYSGDPNYVHPPLQLQNGKMRYANGALEYKAPSGTAGNEYL